MTMTRQLAALLSALLCALLWVAAAEAQTWHDVNGTIVPGSVPLIGCSTIANCAGPVSASNPMPVTGTFTASLGGFTPSASGARMTPLAVTTSDTSGALPTGAVVVVENVGAANPMFCNVNGVAATTSDQEISAASWFAFTIPSGVTTLHCIATGGSTTANGLGGAGLPTGAGGGGGGGSGGSNASVGSTGSAVPGSSTYGGMSVGGNLTGFVGTANGLKVDGSAATQPVSGTFWQATQPISAAALPLPTNAATSTLQSALNILMGSPFQAGGSIGNTAFGISGTLPAFAATPTFNLGTLNGAATAANQEVTIAGTSATSAQGVQGVTGGVAMPVSAAALPLPTGAATSANQTTANTSLATIATNTGAATPAGSNTIGGVTQSGAPWSFNQTQVNGVALGSPVAWGSVPTGVVPSANVNCVAGCSSATSITGWAGGTLGAMATYGTSPGAVLVPGVNANVTASALPTGAATAAGLTTINTTLGSPFQAGGSVGNTAFGISGTLPAYAATPTFNLGTLNGAATSVNQTNGSQKTQIVDGSGNVIASTSNNLNVQCANCSGSGVSTGDNTTWTAGTSLFAGIGGAYQTTVTNNPLIAGGQGFAQLTQYRALMTDWYNSSGTEMGTASSPVQVSVANTGANGTAIKVDGSAATQPVSGTVTANAGTNLNTSALALETGGNLAGINTLVGAKTDAKSTATDATSVSAMQVWKEISAMEQAPASRAVTNAGTFAVQPTSWGGVTLGGASAIGTSASGNVIGVQGVSGGVAMPTSAAAGLYATGFAPDIGSSTTPAWTGSGTPTLLGLLQGLYNVASGPISPQTGAGHDIGGTELLYWGSASLAAGTGWGTAPSAGAIVGNVNAAISAIPVGGASISSEIVPNNTTAVVVKASAGTLYAAQVYGIGSGPAYLKIYNATSATCGSGTPVLRWMIPAAATAANGTGSNIPIPAQGIALGTGLTYCVTGGITDADTTAPAASSYLINIEYD